MTTAHRDEARYRKLSTPQTRDDANKNINGFFAELGKIREQFGIPEVAVIVGVNVDYGNGKEGMAMAHAAFGDNMRTEGLMAYGLGEARAEHREFINRLAAGRKRDA